MVRYSWTSQATERLTNPGDAPTMKLSMILSRMSHVANVRIQSLTGELGAFLIVDNISSIKKDKGDCERTYLFGGYAL